MPQLRNVIVTQRGEAGDVLVRDLMAALMKRCQRLFHVPRAPVQKDVPHEEGVVRDFQLKKLMIYPIDTRDVKVIMCFFLNLRSFLKRLFPYRRPYICLCEQDYGFKATDFGFGWPRRRDNS